jgi:hypothetical protein
VPPAGDVTDLQTAVTGAVAVSAAFVVP